MTSLKYKDENGFWQEFQVGTNVVANPIIAGTESELTGLQVGDAKYKMPAGSKLYRHFIRIDDGSSIFIYFSCYTSNNEPINTISKIQEVCGSNSLLYGAVNSQYGNGVVSFRLSQNNNKVTVYGCVSNIAGDGSYVFNSSSQYTVTNIIDTVIEV